MRRKITKDDWQSILRIMDKYNRDDGWVALIDDDFVFFESDLNGCHAMYVTRSDVEQNIEEYDEID